jgi:hypothetical protein
MDERFMRLAPIAARWVQNATGNLMRSTGYTIDDLINDAFAYGKWRKYTDASDGGLLVQLKHDMMKALATWTGNKAMLGGSGRAARSITFVAYDKVDEEVFSVEKYSSWVEDVAMLADIIVTADLTEGEKESLREYYFMGIPLRQIAKESGVHPQIPSVRHRKALKKLRAVAESKDYEY